MGAPDPWCPVPTPAAALLAVFMLAGCSGHASQAAGGASPSPVSSPSPSDSRGPAAAPSASPGPLFDPDVVNLSVKGFWSWAFLDFKSGQIAGSTPADALSDTASMSKAWVAADFLRRAAEKNQQPNSTIMAELSTMIRDSDTTHAYEFHVANGNLGSIQRMIKLCDLTDTKGV